MSNSEATTFAAERERAFFDEQQAYGAIHTRKALLISAAIFLLFGGWEIALGGHYVLGRIVIAAVLALLALLASRPSQRSRWATYQALCVAVACVGASLLARVVPRSDEFLLGSHLSIIVVASALAVSVRTAWFGGALQLASLLCFTLAGGPISSVLVTVTFLLPALGSGVWLTAMRVRQQRDQFALRAALAEQRTLFEALATTDALTGLLNRRAFDDHGTRLLKLARRHRRPLSIIAIDIDFFKRVNDTHGHAIGDRALKLVAQCCADGLRSADVIARIGGEELCVLLPDTELDGALVVAERLRRTLEGRRLEVGSRRLRLTISLGAAALDGDASLTDLVAAADAALYDAKRDGRNLVRPAPRAPATLRIC